MNKALDVSPYDDPAVTKPAFTLATSALQLETRDGLLPRSTMIMGPTYDFKEHLKERWSEIRYTDLVFGQKTKAAWVLPVSAETTETGTLADFLRELGGSVIEEDLDEEEDESDEDEREGNELVDDEAEEAEEGE